MNNRKEFVHGFAIVCGVVALICSVLTTTWCEMFTFQPDFSRKSNTTGDVPTLKFGLWGHSETNIVTASDGETLSLYVYESCNKYPDSVEIDSKWKAARAFSIMTPILGFLLLMAVCCGSSLNDMMWKSVAMKFMILMPLFQGLTMLIYKSDACSLTPELSLPANETEIFKKLEPLFPNDCEQGKTNNINITAIVFWFVTGLAMMFVGKCGDEDEVVPKERMAATTGVDGKLDVAEGEEQALQEQTEFRA